MRFVRDWSSVKGEIGIIVYNKSNRNIVIEIESKDVDRNLNRERETNFCIV